MNTNTCQRKTRRRRRQCCALPLSLSLVLFSCTLQHSCLPVHAEDGQAYSDLDDYFTRAPSPYPTPQPTLRPTPAPTRGGDDFYNIDETDDGYTAEEQSAKIYFSSVSDVILCLMCTFFWVLWLVGAIFPTKLQHLYKSEGIVVQGYVVDSYLSTTAEDLEMREMQMDGQMPDDMDMDMDLDQGFDRGGFDSNDGAGIMMDDDMNLPVYHAIVSYVVPGRVASGRRKMMRSIRPVSGGLSPVEEDYVLHNQKPIQTDYTRCMSQTELTKDMLASASAVLGASGAGSGRASGAGSGKPPKMLPWKRGISIPNNSPSPVSNSSSCCAVGADNDTPTPPDHSSSRKISLLDYSKSFDTTNEDPRWTNNDKGYYKYNRRDDSDYDTPIDDDEFEDDPEYIGNLFYQFGMFERPKRKAQPVEPVRVKKRFETNELLATGMSNIDIIVLPGQPGSGLLKSDFEQEEDYKLTCSKEDDMFGPGNQMGEFSTGMIGAVLAAVSVIGAVHGALTLPYQERACKFDIMVMLWV